MRYRERERNQLANCMLLTAQENGAGGKSSTPPAEWFVGERAKESYLEMHLVPRDPALWKLERFEDFLAERKKLVAEKLNFLLILPERQTSLQAIVHSPVERGKSIEKLIDAGLRSELSPLVLTYRGQNFSGVARRDGIELAADGMVYSPSAADYAKVGFPRSSENGWAVWKNTEGRSPNDLFEQLRPPTIDDL
jgi:hypothetical protein